MTASEQVVEGARLMREALGECPPDARLGDGSDAAKRSREIHRRWVNAKNACLEAERQALASVLGAPLVRVYGSES